MSDQDRPGLPDDEPVIGGGAQPPPPPPPADRPAAPPPGDSGGDEPIGSAPLPRAPRTPVDPWESRRLRRDPYELRSFSGDGPRAGYYGATRRSAGRTVAFYLFGLAALAIGGILIFLLFRVLNDDELPPPPVEAPEVEPKASIESPVPGERITVNEDRAVIVRVVSGENVVRFELLVSGIFEDRQFSGRVTGENTYAAVLTVRLEAAGGYELVVRAYTVSGEVIETDPVRVIAVPPVTGTPEVVTIATIVATGSLHTGPGQEHNQAGTLERGDVVTVTCQAAGGQWLEIERGDGLYVRRSAVGITDAEVDQLDDCGAVPPPRETPTPPPDAEDTSTPTTTATSTPVVPANAPDFIPLNAELIEGGAVLRITLRNVSTNPFAGSIVVRVEGVSATQSEKVGDVSMEPNGTDAINFDIDPPLTEQSKVTVTIDPGDVIVESQEDNNVAEFILVEPPPRTILSLVTGTTGGILSVTIKNEGGPLPPSDALLVVSVPGQKLEWEITPLVLAEDESITIDGISAPQTGEIITITLSIDDIDVATTTVLNPNLVEGTPEPETGSEPETETETQPEPGTEPEPDDQPEATPEADEPAPPDEPEPPVEPEDE